MKTRLGSVALLLAGMSFAAASQTSPYEETLKQAIESFEKIGATLRKIDDEASAAAAKPELRKSAEAFLAARAKAAKMQPPEKAEKVRLEKQYKPKLEEAMKKMFTEVRRVELIDGGKEALKEISGVLKKDSK